MSIPTLTYVGSIDLSNSFGSTQYNIFFDPDINTNGNVLMFEYKLQNSDVSSPDPNTVTLGFVDTENANQTIGISNQWLISIPSLSDIYNPMPTKTIQVRVIYGVFGSADILTTPWSNPLNVHNPPPQQTIDLALFTTPNVGDPNDLYVILQNNPNIDYDAVKFVIAYYYQNQANETVWDISDLLDSTPVTYLGQPSRLLSINNFGTVNSDSTIIYTSVYCVYPFTDTVDGTLNNYYSVSHISTTYDAESADLINVPTITGIDYQVYDITSLQNMVINWNPPDPSILPIYTVENYTLEYSTDGTNWTVINDEIPGNQTSYTFDVSSFDCGTTLSYRVKATEINGSVSDYSNIESENIFKYALVPENLGITNIVVNGDNTINMTVQFDNPTNIGCGSSLTAYFSVLVNGTQQTTVNYNSSPIGTPNYSVTLTNLNVPSPGTVEVYLNTQDTNSANFLAGASVSEPYATLVLTLNTPYYKIYDNAWLSQVIYLNWDMELPVGWTLDNYTVELSLNSGSFTAISPTTLNTEYFYSIPIEDQVCGNTFVFQVKATISNLGTSYTFTSNSSSPTINLFKYAEAPSITVNWVSANSDNTLMDIQMSFTQPNRGCGAGQNFVVTVYDNSSVAIATQSISYVGGATSYPVSFDDITYSSTGTIEVYLNTQDTNSETIYEGAVGSISYTASRIPIYVNVTNSSTNATFRVVSNTQLAPFGGISYVSGGTVLTYEQWNDSEAYQTIPFIGTIATVPSIGPNGEYLYDVTMTAEAGQNFPSQMQILCANVVGIGSLMLTLD